MSQVGDRFISEGIECEVVWTGGHLLPVFHKPGANCSLGNWYQERRAQRSVEPRAHRAGVVFDSRRYQPAIAPGYRHASASYKPALSTREVDNR